MSGLSLWAKDRSINGSIQGCFRPGRWGGLSPSIVIELRGSHCTYETVQRRKPVLATLLRNWSRRFRWWASLNQTQTMRRNSHFLSST